jgi:Winged helix-turn helix
MAVVSMSDKEFARLDVLLNLEAGRIRTADACTLLGLQRRQVFRLLRGFRERGALSLVSSRRGRPSNNRLPEAVRELAVAIVRERYADFGPTLACEKLSQRHGCRVSRETLRQWMIAEGLWLDRRRRPPSVHQPRNRRARVGELVQIDGSQHFWFENRGPECTLIAYVDDATSRILHAAFVPCESTFDDLRETRAYVARFGRPIAFYSDKHAIFRVSKR